MASIVVVKLLGINISYTFLQNKILSLWKLTHSFQLMDVFPSSMMVRIRLPGLLGFLYKKKILEEIGGLIGTVNRLDFQIDKGLRGKFARMIMVNEMMPRVEFESLPPVCFDCGHFGHTKEACPGK
uniref:CCHC-type domain-containing protein n=1 Tax=Gossypium raimondii TaxID=29730 RepID=A0A0D2U232_GOSRA|nr:hypothetical protein B456_009G395100 [Gossypium raimondii]